MTHIVQIGNSFGVRIPKVLIQQLGFNTSMNLIFKVTEDGLLISPEKKAREGWEQKFKSNKKSPASILGEFPNEFDKDEWTW